MGYETPDKMPDNNPFEGVEDMKISDDPTKHHWDDNEEVFKKDKEIFEKYSKLGNLDKGSPEKKWLEERGTLQSGQCEISNCPVGKKRMGERCFGCDKYKSGKIRNIGNNMPEGPEKIIEPKDEEDKPATS